MLNTQLAEFKLYDKEQKIGKYIIGCIDDDGYLRRNIDEIIDDLIFKENLICTPKEIQKLLSIIQGFDPPGIGARNLQECLFLQLERKEKISSVLLAIDIINLQFKQFVNKHYSKICDKFKIDLEQLKTAIKEIEKLNPKPAANSSQTKYTQQIIPDFTINLFNEDITFTLNARNAPTLNISKDYLNMLNLYKESGESISKKKQASCIICKAKIRFSSLVY